jgi:hypothetical protein
MEIYTPEKTDSEEQELSPFAKETLALLDNGDITEQDAHDRYVRHTITNEGFDALDRDDMLHAYDSGYVPEDVAERWVEKRDHPYRFQVEDVGKGLLRGPMNLAQDFVEWVNPLMGWLDAAGLEADPFSEDAFEKPTPMTDDDFKAMEEFKPEVHTGLGVLAEMGSELAAAYYMGPAQIVAKVRGTATMAKLATSGKAGRYAYRFILGNLAFWGAEQIAFDPHEGRLADWVDAGWSTPVSRYLKSNEEDSEAEARFKMFVESAIIDTALEGVGMPLIKAFNVYRKRLSAVMKGDAHKIAKVVDESLGEGGTVLGNPGIPKTVDELKTKLNKLGLEEFEHQYNPLNLEARLVKELTDTGMERKAAKEQVRPQIVEYAAEYDKINGKALAAKAEAQAAEEAVKVPNRAKLKQMDATELADSVRRAAKGELVEEEVEDLLHNMGKFETTDDVLQVINQMAERMVNSADDIKFSRGKQTWDKSAKTQKQIETNIRKKSLQIAEATGSNPDEVYKGVMRNEMAQTAEGLRMLEARMMAYEEFLLGYDELLTKAADEAVTNADFLRVKEMMTFAYELHGLSHGISAEIGRALQYRRKMRQASRFDFADMPENWIDDVMESEGHKLRKTVKTFSKMKKDGLKAKAFFLRKTMKRKWWQHAVEIRQAALVSGFRTQIRNMVGNTIAGGFETASMILGQTGRSIISGDFAHMRKLHHLAAGYLTGIKTAMRVSGVPFEDLLNLDWKAFVRGMKQEGTKGMDSKIGTFWQALWSGRPITDFLTKQDNFAFTQSKFMSALKLPFHPLTAADEFFKSVAFHGRMHYQMASDVFDDVYAHGRANKLNKKQMGKNLNDKVKLHLQDPPDHILDAAIEFSRDVTFTSSLKNSPVFNKMNELLNSNAVGATIKFMFVPFWSVNANIMRFAAYRSPIAVFKKKWRDTIMGKFGADAQAELVGKMVLSTGLILWVADKFSKGEMTGTAPRGQRQAWKNANVQENSFWNEKDQTWHSYQSLEPFNTLFSITADIMRLHDQWQVPENEWTDVAENALLLFAENLGNKSFMKGVGDAVQFGTDPDRMNMKKFMIDLTASSVPYSMLMQQWQEGTDDLVRDTRKWIDVQHKNIDRGKMLPKRHAIYGSTLVKEPKSFGIVNVRKETDDPVLWEMFVVGANVGPPARQREIINAKGLTEKHDFNKNPDDYDEYMQVIEKVWDMGFRDALGQVIGSKAWKDIDNDPWKAKWFSMQVSAVRKAAFEIWKTGRMDLLDASVQQLTHNAGSFTGQVSLPDEDTRLYHFGDRNQ